MVFGFGRGKIDVVLDKYSFLPGEVIKGKVVLKLKKPVKARELRVEFYGIRETRESAVSIKSVTVGRQAGERRAPQRERTYIHQFKQRLDGEKEYHEGEYSFKIKIPKTLGRATVPEGGVAGTLLKAASLFSGVRTTIYWYVKAVVNVPGLDITRKVQVNVG